MRAVEYLGRSYKLFDAPDEFKLLLEPTMLPCRGKPIAGINNMGASSNENVVYPCIQRFPGMPIPYEAALAMFALTS